MKQGRRITPYIAAILITAVLSVALTLAVVGARDRGLAPIRAMQTLILKEHYGKAVAEDALVQGALEGMVNVLNDPYARYYTADEYKAYLDKLGGEYHGIGALVGQPTGAGVPVLKVYQGSPAQIAGLQGGDVIAAADGSTLSDVTLEEAAALIGGKDGTVVHLNVLRDSESLTLTVTRGQGVANRVTYQMLNRRTGYIRIDQFTGTAADEFAAALKDLTNQGMRALVVDLRDDPGGELSQVVKIADALLGEGVIVTVRSADGRNDAYRSDAKHVSVPLAVLVNENSASASELLAAAVQDSGTGVVVGTRTYGKGVVQTTSQLPGNAGWVKLTTAAYYTPKGKNVDGTGVQPDIEVELSGSAKGKPVGELKIGDDVQLQTALASVRDKADAQSAG